MDDGRASWRIAGVSVRHAASLLEWVRGEAEPSRAFRGAPCAEHELRALKGVGVAECGRLRAVPAPVRSAGSSLRRRAARRRSHHVKQAPLRRSLNVTSCLFPTPAYELHASGREGQQGSPQEPWPDAPHPQSDGVGALRVSRRQGFFFNDLENPAQARKSTL
ncbi:MAG TPA: hypothetical protein ENF26_00525 [Methanomicrobia archaeon]|nr:hypothetical protein [Methanomicrobia archaeon]HEX58623.1 hypothetical protein [Methanomicrobia archaeon]